MGVGSTVYVGRVSAVELHGVADNFLNTGSLIASVRAGKGAEIERVAGLYVENASGANIVNKGNISVTIDAPEAKSVTKAAGIWIQDSTGITLSNLGAIYLWNNAPGADIRTLRIETSPMTVTLSDGFSIVFGQPGIDKRPIYVDGVSTLNLNNTDLLVHKGIDLQFNSPYFLIEKADGGTVTGTWGDIVKMFMLTNPDISVGWYDAERGANSAVTFSFTPQDEGVEAGSGAAITAINAAQAQLMDIILGHNVFGRGFFGRGFFADASGDRRPMLFASAGASDAFIPIIRQDKAYKTGIYILPYFTKVSDSGLGADVDSRGILLGLERRYNNITAGISFGYGSNDVDFTGIRRGNNENQNVYSIGAYGIHNADRWYAILSANYHMISHDYAGRTGANLELKETADYDSKSFVLHAKGGPKFEGKDWGIYPSAGLRWTNWNRDSYTTSVIVSPNWNRTVASLDENWVDFLIGVDASKRWTLQNKATFGLTAGVGLEHALSNNDISVAQTMQAQRAVAKQDIADTSLTGNLAAIYSKDRLRLKLGVTGQTNRDYNAYSGFAQIGLAF